MQILWLFAFLLSEAGDPPSDFRPHKKEQNREVTNISNQPIIFNITYTPWKVKSIISDEEKKELIATLVKEIQIYPEGESDTPLKSMKFNFPVYKDGQEVNEIFLDKQTNVETLVYLGK